MDGNSFIMISEETAKYLKIEKSIPYLSAFTCAVGMAGRYGDAQADKRADRYIRNNTDMNEIYRNERSEFLHIGAIKRNINYEEDIKWLKKSKY